MCHCVCGNVNTKLNRVNRVDDKWPIVHLRAEACMRPLCLVRPKRSACGCTSVRAEKPRREHPAAKHSTRRQSAFNAPLDLIGTNSCLLLVVLFDSRSYFHCEAEENEGIYYLSVSTGGFYHEEHVVQFIAACCITIRWDPQSLNQILNIITIMYVCVRDGPMGNSRT